MSSHVRPPLCTRCFARPAAHAVESDTGMWLVCNACRDGKERATEARRPQQHHNRHHQDRDIHNHNQVHHHDHQHPHNSARVAGASRTGGAADCATVRPSHSSTWPDVADASDGSIVLTGSLVPTVQSDRMGSADDPRLGQNVREWIEVEWNDGPQRTDVEELYVPRSPCLEI